MLAHDRGDHTEAGARYRQPLEIKERLGDQAGMASSISQMGILLTERGHLPDAVSWHIRALSIRLRLGARKAGIDVRALLGLRRNLGADDFTEVVGDQLDDENQANLISLLDRFDQVDGGAENGLA